MAHQHGAQLGINIAALDMALALTRSRATSKVLTAPGTFAVDRECARHRLVQPFAPRPLALSHLPPPGSDDRDWLELLMHL